MNDARPGQRDTLLKGDRVPNFSVPAADGKILLFYEYAVGRPLVIGACAEGWDPTRRRRYADTVRTLAEAANAQSLTLGGNGSLAPDVDDDHLVLPDAGARLRSRLFADVMTDHDGVFAVTDTNLRLLEGCVTTAEDFDEGVPTPEMNAVLAEALELLGEDDGEAATVAPVLMIPRVLAEELCELLCARFDEWHPVASPMPSGNGRALAPDPARKTRRDATIDDPELEQEVIACIARRVLPEVAKAFHYRATRFERPKLVAYSAENSGHFAAHRDNTAPDTAHRRFALTLNLNSGSYAGGELQFPEYGCARGYSPPAGGAIVFSCSHAHRVTPVTRGERFALVSFMFGEEDRPS
jgi:predicted 2-oxoglutarate/Fe(II)-dependent dioxygenase YbiX